MQQDMKPNHISEAVHDVFFVPGTYDSKGNSLHTPTKRSPSLNSGVCTPHYDISYDFHVEKLLQSYEDDSGRRMMVS